ncbi:MAG: hypothetical protein HQK99_09745 [Nitrospirae bacterium]|nr:hypothetical protein [Nitrospirota bacterium]
MKRAVHSLILILSLLVICPSLWAVTSESSFTQQDRERLIRLEEGLKSTNQRMEEGFKSTNQRMEEGFKSSNQRINDLYGQVNVLISVVFLSIVATIGLVIWDRRTTLSPAVRKIREIEDREEKVEKVLKELALRDPNVAEANKHAGLL